MKKFLIVSIVLILISSIIFGISLYHYIDVTGDKSTPDQTAPTIFTPEKEEETIALTSDSVPQQWEDGGIFSKNYDKAYKDTRSMTTEQMVGQILIGTCPTDGTAEDTVTKYALGGYFFKSDNFFMMNLDQIKEQVASYQQKAKIPMIMSVEEEGGAYCPVSDADLYDDYEFKPIREVYAEGGVDALKDVENNKATMLASVGINLNFAPVCDMAVEQNQIMYSRSLGGTLEDTQTYVKNTTETSQSKGVSVALKHFPGYGTTPDSLDSVVTDERAVSSFESNDFLPFKAGIEKDAHCVMMSNLYVKNLDPNCVVSLSDYAHTVLRNELKFSGLTITDNLNNADYSQYANNNNVYVQAVLAGNDMIMVDNIDEAYKAILDAVNDGTIKQEVLQKACMRVLAYKYTAGIIK